ncbi:ATP-dependent helicase [Xanthomonas phaseoli]|uniref:ATP-dependent helicase n=1 Tax=Xanthomonas phaseoli TaxID=1985254 RepID=UPI001ADD3D76|nr:ATP-dependent helicase [Xanthomonas phaseoli]MBO9855037.1 ATP-dependent helicase [Xanthomonas phaseoli pv. dieffenbachiae]MBO9968951.1 ATP-dependent helicase [Xanthomonas phaseoli pv. dieffenbachiae]MBO9989143.1 ATP-dependent helicase [Xanthomonas phaseoli pv. dieffenbachiae]
MNNSSHFKARLSSEQIEIVEHVDGPLLVVAGPGSGKTRVLTERIRNLLTNVDGHFRILALTFTNKAADEMKERLQDLGSERDRAFIGTLHGFCLEVLTERGKLVGVDDPPNIFEQTKDRRDVLLRAIDEDPVLQAAIQDLADSKERGKKVDQWLSWISYVKSHPITCAVIDDEFAKRVFDAYEAGMRASNAYDFDDLLLLVYRLMVENIKLAEIYRKLYRFVCIDEAQDMNEAQYAVICALCSDGFRSLMMVGDPRQSIYGFNTSGPEYMERFGRDFKAKRVHLTANYRSSRAVVRLAQQLDPNYMVAMQLPIEGRATVLVGDDEQDEARLIANELERLFQQGDRDVEGGVDPSKCAILGRTRFALLAIEAELKGRGIVHYKRLSANHENESELVEDFQLGLRLLANPKDRLHASALAKRWGSTTAPWAEGGAIEAVKSMANASSKPISHAVVESLSLITANSARLDLMPALKRLEQYADGLDEGGRQAVYEDVAVFRQEWDQYLRTSSGPNVLSSFLSSKALGVTQKSVREGVALLTVHSAKGLEFDVVFLAGMAEGMFPDWRASQLKEAAEEVRNAFVAVTRSKRVLYLSYPATRMMPWGDKKRQTRSRFLASLQ